MKVMNMTTKSLKGLEQNSFYEVEDEDTKDDTFDVKGKYCYEKRYFLIMNDETEYLKRLKGLPCKVVSYELGIVKFKNGDTVLLIPSKLDEVRNLILKGVNIIDLYNCRSNWI